jgi:hypothetical protein
MTAPDHPPWEAVRRELLAMAGEDSQLPAPVRLDALSSGLHL